jgi:acetyl-CoA acyltransferase
VRDAVIVDAVRSAHGRRNGALAEVHPVDLMADVLQALVERNQVDPATVEDVILGCVSQIGDQSSNIARFAVLAAGWPDHIPGVTVNRACGSSQEALDLAASKVMAGAVDVVIAGGVECMSRVPLGAARTVGVPYGPRVLLRYDDFSFNQGISAELLAKSGGMSRTQLDEYSIGSHEKAAAAIDAGLFDGQLVPIDVGETRFTVDEGVRRDTSVGKLAALKPAFVDNGVIHAGNSSQISDGAAAMLVMTSERARDLGLTPIVRYCCGVAVGDDPVRMLTGPIPATRRLLDRAGLKIGDLGVYEINEAFSPVPIAWSEELGADPSRLNPLGGAIALGHPLGASGASLMTRMVHHMREQDIRYGLQAMCEGGGTANATLVELVTT